MQVAREAHFSGQSYLNLTPPNVPSLRNNFYASFSFRTGKKEGLMFYHHDQVGPASCFVFAPSHCCLSRFASNVCVGTGRSVSGVSERRARRAESRQR